MFLVQALAPQASTAENLESERSPGDSFSAIPLLALLLPIAAVAAYVLEWRGAKKDHSKAV